MKVLNAFQLQVLNKGSQEEYNKQIRIHRAEPLETGRLLDLYYNHFHECDIEIVIDALLSLYDFWSCYFTCGAEEAFRILERENI